MSSSTTGSEGCSCGIGRCFRTNVSIHWTFWFNVLFQLIFAVIQYTKSWKYILMIFMVWGPFSIITLVFHEMGHIWRTRAFGGSATYTMLWPLGGFNDAHVINGTCLQEFCVAFMGPMMHIPQMLFWVMIIAVSAPNGLNYYGDSFDLRNFENGPGPWFAELAERLLNINIMVFVINMILPAYPMDASFMIASLCVHFGTTVETAGYVLVLLGGILAVIAIVVGILGLINGSGNGLFYLLIGLFVLYTSWSLWKMINNNVIHLHPIFASDCYKGRSTGANRDVEMGNQQPSSSPAYRPHQEKRSPLPKRSDAPKPKKIKKKKGNETTGNKKSPNSGNSGGTGRKPRNPRT